jgi:hypothetical protein
MRAMHVAGSTSALSQRWLLGALAGLFLLLSIPYAVKVAANPDSPPSAVMRWRDQILALSADVDIWEKCIYPNPPIMALLLMPLVQLPPVAASLAWFFLKSAMAILAIHWVFRMAESGGRPFPTSAKVVAILLALRPLAGDLTHGNVNLLILFLVVAGLYAYYRQRDLTAGVLLALAIACKVTPALFVPYFVWKRAWWTLAGCFFGLILFFWIIPGLFLGQSNNARYLNSWVNKMIVPYVLEGHVTPEHNNQSLPGLVYRLGSHAPSFSDDRVGYVPREYHNILDVDTRILSWSIKGCMVLFVLMVAWSCRTPTQPRAGWELLAEFSIVVLGMLLFSERTWKHHCVTLLLPFTALIYYLLTCRVERRQRIFLVGSLLGAVLLMALTGTGIGLDRFGKLAQVYGAYVWAYLLLMAAMVVMLRQQPRASHYAVEQYRVTMDVVNQAPSREPEAQARGSVPPSLALRAPFVTRPR